MSDLNTEIKIGADASGVEAGVGKAKRSLADLGASAKKAGQDAAGGMSGIGAGAEASAKKVAAAERNMVGSLQRQIAAMEAGDKTSRKYQETLARMRGVDVNALKPYLDQLDSLKGKASLAERAQASLNSVIFKATAVLAVTAGIAAYARTIVNGIDALNDLKDATGASIENISALEDVAKRAGTSFDVVSTSMIKFNDVLKNAKAGSGAELALKAIGLSAEELKRIDPAEALLQTATALNGFADDGNKARITQELFGKSLKDVAPFLKDLADKGELVAKVTTQQAEEAERLNRHLFTLQTSASDAARSLLNNMVPAINSVIAAMKQGGIGAGLDQLGDSLFDWSGNAQRKGIKNLESDIKSLREQQSAITLDIFGQKGSIQKDIDAKIAALSAAKASYFKLTSGVGGGRGSVNPALVDVRASVGDIPDPVKPRSGGSRNSAADAATREIAEQSKLLAELSGLTASFSTDWERLNTIYAKGQLSLEGLTDAQAKLLDKQPFAVALAREETAAQQALTKAREDDAKAYEATVGAAAKMVGSVADRITALQQELTVSEMTRTQKIGEAEAVELLNIARLREKATILEMFDPRAQELAHLKDEITQRERLVGLLGQKRVLDTNTTAAKEAADAWQKTADSIESGLTDALMRGFENGKSFGENLGDSLTNYFKTVVAREIATAITRAIMAAMASTQWGQLLSGVLGGGTGGGTDWLSMAGKAYDAYTKGAAGAGGGAGAGAGAGAAATTAAAAKYGTVAASQQTAMLAAQEAGMTSAATTTAATGTGATAASSTWMTYAGYAAPIVAAIKVAENLYSTGYNRTALGVQSSKAGDNNSLGQYTYGRGNTTTGDSGARNWMSNGILALEATNQRKLMDAVGMNEKWADIFSGTVLMATLIGRKLKGYGYQANIDGADVDVKGYEYYKGGLFRSNKTVTQDVNKQDADELRAGIENVRESARSMAQAMGYSTEAIDNYSGSLRINLKGVKTGEEAAQRYGEAMEKLQRQMLNNIPGLKMNEEQFKEFIEGITKSMQDVGITAGGIADIITSGMLGRISQAQVGEQLSDMVIGGIYNAIAGQYAGQIASVFTGQIIQPIFTAIAAGVPISQAISQQAIANVVATAQNAAATLNAIFADPSFRAAIAGVQQAISGISIAAGSVRAPSYKAAVSSYNAAAEAAKRAAEETKRAWQSVADSLSDEIRRIKGELLGDTSQGQSYYMAQFNAATTAARAGDQAAANMLPELSQAVLDIARSTAGSLADLQFLQSTTIASLSATRAIISQRYGLSIPKFDVGTNYVPQDMIAQIHKGEAIVPAAYNPAAGGMANNGAGLLAQAQALRDMADSMTRMAAGISAIETNTRETRKTLDRVSQGGDALLTVAA